MSDDNTAEKDRITELLARLRYREDPENFYYNAGLTEVMVDAADAIETLQAAFDEADAYAKVNAMNVADWFTMQEERDAAVKSLAEAQATIERVRALVMNTDGDYIAGESFDGLAGEIQSVVLTAPSSTGGNREPGPNEPADYWHGAGCEEDDRG